MTLVASEMRVLVIRRGGAKLLLHARERSRGLLFHEGFRGGAVANRAKARSGLPVRLGR